MTNLECVQGHRGQLVAMVRELRTHRGVLLDLENHYGVFLFTGGEIPQSDFAVDTLTAYLEHPLAADQLATRDADRYRRLVENLANLGQGDAVPPRPRSLRCRRRMTDLYAQASSEVRSAGNTLASTLAMLLGGGSSPMKRSPARLSASTQGGGQ